MEFLGPGFFGWDGISSLAKLDTATIKKVITERLIVSYAVGNSVSYTNNFGADHVQHLRRRLAKFGSSDHLALSLHFGKLPKKVPAFLITHYIKLICGALNSDGERRRKFAPDGSVHADKCDDNPFPCYLCGLGDGERPGDASMHIFASCRLTRDAWEAVLGNFRGPRDVSWDCLFEKRSLPLFITDYPLADPEAGYCRLALTMAFCWAVHKITDQIKAGRSAEGAESRIVTLTLTFKNIWAPAIKKSKKLKQ
jgi:hypothetical protein